MKGIIFIRQGIFEGYSRRNIKKGFYGLFFKFQMQLTLISLNDIHPHQPALQASSSAIPRIGKWSIFQRASLILSNGSYLPPLPPDLAFLIRIQTYLLSGHRIALLNRPLQKRERTGKEYGCFPFVWKTKIFKWKINYMLESLPRIEVFGGGKWQNGSSTNITQNREFVWIG